MPEAPLIANATLADELTLIVPLGLLLLTLLWLGWQIHGRDRTRRAEPTQPARAEPTSPHDRPAR